MKRLRRPRVELPTLRRGGTGGDEANRRELLFQENHQNGNVNKDFADHWGAPDVRGALWAMQGRSCAYCDRELPGNDRGDVEHFRPKDTYWWLAYKFENYFLSCSVCNSSYKKNYFPMLPRGKAFDYARKDRLNRERRALIDPVVDAIDRWYGINFSQDTVKRKGFQFIISSPLRIMERRRCEATLDLFKLNRDSELLRARQIAVHAALSLVKKAMDGDHTSRLELQRRAARFCAHSFAVREVIESYAKQPDFLPSAEDEVTWLIEDLLEVLKFALNALEERPHDTTETKQRDRCAWALAVLMKDPPALSTEAIRMLLERAGVLPVVEPFYNGL